MRRRCKGKKFRSENEGIQIWWCKYIYIEYGEILRRYSFGGISWTFSKIIGHQRIIENV